MGWQPHLLYPSIYRVLVDAEMRSYILDPDPSFFSGHFIPLRQVLPAPVASRQAGRSHAYEHQRNRIEVYTTGPIRSRTNGGIPDLRKSPTCKDSGCGWQPTVLLQAKFRSGWVSNSGHWGRQRIPMPRMPARRYVPGSGRGGKGRDRRGGTPPAGRWPACIRSSSAGGRGRNRRGCRRGGRGRPSSGVVGARPTPPEGDVVGTHNGLRSHGRFRCLVIRFRRTRLARLPADTYRRGVRNVEAGARAERFETENQEGCVERRK